MREPSGSPPEKVAIPHAILVTGVVMRVVTDEYALPYWCTGHWSVKALIWHVQICINSNVGYFGPKMAVAG